MENEFAVALCEKCWTHETGVQAHSFCPSAFCHGNEANMFQWMSLLGGFGGGGEEKSAPISRLYYQWGDRRVVKISKTVFHRFVQKWRLVAISLFMSVMYVPALN